MIGWAMAHLGHPAKPALLYNELSCNNTFDVKNIWSSTCEIESYLEVSKWTDWRLQDHISQYGQGS